MLFELGDDLLATEKTTELEPPHTRPTLTLKTLPELPGLQKSLAMIRVLEERQRRRLEK